MIVLSPKGLTVNQWFKEIKKRNTAISGMRKSKSQKRSERAIAGENKPFYVSFRDSFKRHFSTRAK